MCLLGVQVTILVEEDLGECELELLVVIAVGDDGREVQPAHPDVAVVLDRERPHPLLTRIPFPEPFQKGMYQRRMPDDLPLQPLQEFFRIQENLLPAAHWLKFTATSVRCAHTLQKP